MPAWLERGLHVWTYGPSMMHAKLAVVDDEFCSVGTFNLNPVSLGLSNEVNVIVRDRGFVLCVAQLFATDRSLSRPVTARELEARSLADRALDRLANEGLRIVEAVVARGSTPVASP
jgi:cardiolipin synthase A/B